MMILATRNGSSRWAYVLLLMFFYLFVCLFLALCGVISPSSLGRSPWNFKTWLEVCELR